MHSGVWEGQKHMQGARIPTCRIGCGEAAFPPSQDPWPTQLMFPWPYRRVTSPASLHIMSLYSQGPRRVNPFEAVCVCDCSKVSGHQHTTPIAPETVYRVNKSSVFLPIIVHQTNICFVRLEKISASKILRASWRLAASGVFGCGFLDGSSNPCLFSRSFTTLSFLQGYQVCMTSGDGYCVICLA